MNAVILTTYPLKKARHGGQIRSLKIMNKYIELFGSCKSYGILGSEFYDEENNFLPFSSSFKFRIDDQDIPFMEDFGIFKQLLEEEKLNTCLLTLVGEDVDILHVEQPWLFPFAVYYRKNINPKCKLIYGSQNIEWSLKKNVLNDYIPKKLLEYCCQLILDAESYAIRNSDLNFAVSKKDKEFIESFREAKKTLLIPNGVEERKYKDVDLAIKKIVETYPKYAVYCASGHPPNIEGLLNLFSEGVGCINPDEKLLIIGGICPCLDNNIQFHAIPNMVKTTVLLGEVNDSELAYLIDNAHLIILPLLTGAGTNLKTAEALVSKKHIVATNIAFRGYSAYREVAGVNITDNPIEFKNLIRHCMGSRLPITTRTEEEFRRNLLWSNQLKPMNSLVEYLKDTQ